MMAMNNQGRPTGIGSAGVAANGSSLLPNEPLLFEIGDADHSGVDLPDVEIDGSFLGGFARKSALDLPGLTEPEAVRHYVRLSRLNYSIDSGMYPLGSCTMKHNPRLNEKMARLPGFADIHPLQPVSTVSGALSLMDQLGHWLLTLTNMEAVALSPKAGAHGEMCGMMAIRAAQQAAGQGAPQHRARAGIRARNKPGDGGLSRLPGEASSRPRRWHGGCQRGEGGALARSRRHHAHQPQYLRAVRTRDHRDRRCGA
jgi:hypothetical protein